LPTITAAANFTPMKTNTINISLTPTQSEFVRRSVKREFGNPGEFFRDLLRERMEQEVSADLKFLKSTQGSAMAGPSEQEIESIVQTQKKVRRELSKK
jgi:Arc/MetJ-type ribon-helix-helix transcriptional regulator